MHNSIGAAHAAARGSGDFGQAQQRQAERRGGAGLGKQVGGHVQAGTAVGAASGAHGQLGHRGNALLGGLTDLMIGDSIADADVHVRNPDDRPEVAAAYSNANENGCQSIV